MNIKSEGGIIKLIVDVYNFKDLYQLFDVIKTSYVQKNNEKYKIVVNSTIGEFHENFGRMIYEHSEIDIHIPVEFTEQTDSMMYLLIGRMVLDTYLPQTYWMQSDEEKKVYEIRG